MAATRFKPICCFCDRGIPPGSADTVLLLSSRRGGASAEMFLRFLQCPLVQGLMGMSLRRNTEVSKLMSFAQSAQSPCSLLRPGQVLGIKTT